MRAIFRVPGLRRGEKSEGLPLAGRLLLELLVVFVGVYAAFALSEFQRQRVEAQRRTQIQAALVSEIEAITANTRRVAEGTPRQIAFLDSLIAAGARPPLQPMIEPIRVDTHIWEATLQSGALELFDVPTVWRISAFYNELNAGFEQLAQLRSLSEAYIIPNLDDGPAAFYDPATGRLRPRFRWYRDGMERLGSIAGRITTHGDSLAAQLRQRR